MRTVTLLTILLSLSFTQDYSLQFDGDDKISISTTSSDLILTSEYTIEVVFKYNGIQDNGEHDYLIERLGEDSSDNDIIRKIWDINNDNSIHGILIQLPLPPHINKEVTASNVVSDVITVLAKVIFKDLLIRSAAIVITIICVYLFIRLIRFVL